MIECDSELELLLNNSKDVESMLALADLYEEKSSDQDQIRLLRLTAQWAQLLLPTWKQLSRPYKTLTCNLSKRSKINEPSDNISVLTQRLPRQLEVTVLTSMWQGLPEIRYFVMRIRPRDMLWNDEWSGVPVEWNGKPEDWQWVKFKDRIMRIARFHHESLKT